jgi:hypothetical protein
MVTIIQRKHVTDQELISIIEDSIAMNKAVLVKGYEDGVGHDTPITASFLHQECRIPLHTPVQAHGLLLQDLFLMELTAILDTVKKLIDESHPHINTTLKDVLASMDDPRSSLVVLDIPLTHQALSENIQ